MESLWVHSNWSQRTEWFFKNSEWKVLGIEITIYHTIPDWSIKTMWFFLKWPELYCDEKIGKFCSSLQQLVLLVKLILVIDHIFSNINYQRLVIRKLWWWPHCIGAVVVAPLHFLVDNFIVASGVTHRQWDFMLN